MLSLGVGVMDALGAETAMVIVPVAVLGVASETVNV